MRFRCAQQPSPRERRLLEDDGGEELDDQSENSVGNRIDRRQRSGYVHEQVIGEHRTDHQAQHDPIPGPMQSQAGGADHGAHDCAIQQHPNQGDRRELQNPSRERRSGANPTHSQTEQGSHEDPFRENWLHSLNLLHSYRGAHNHLSFRKCSEGQENQIGPLHRRRRTAPARNMAAIARPIHRPGALRSVPGVRVLRGWGTQHGR